MILIVLKSELNSSSCMWLMTISTNLNSSETTQDFNAFCGKHLQQCWALRKSSTFL